MARHKVQGGAANVNGVSDPPAMPTEHGGIIGPGNGEPTPPETIRTVVLEKVYAAKARENYVELLSEVAPKKIEDVVLGLEKYFARLRSESGAELVQCDVCGGYSPEQLGACPFCDEGRAAPSKEEKPESHPERDIIRADNPDDVSLAEIRQDRDVAVRLQHYVRRRYGSMVEDAYDLGEKLQAAKDVGLHVALGLKNFGAYLDEIGIPRPTAERFMAIAREFTRDDLRRVGGSHRKLALLLPLNPEAREALIESAAESSTRELAEQARAEQDRQREAEEAAAAKKGQKAPPKRGRPSRLSPKAKAQADKKEIAAKVAERQAELDAKHVEPHTYCFVTNKDSKRVAPVESGARKEGDSIVSYSLFRDENGKYLAFENGEHGPALVLGVDPARSGIVEVELAVGDDEP